MKKTVLTMALIVVAIIIMAQTTTVVTYRSGAEAIMTPVSYIETGDSLKISYKIPYGDNFNFVKSGEKKGVDVSFENFKQDAVTEKAFPILTIFKSNVNVAGSIDIAKRIMTFTVHKGIKKSIFNFYIDTSKGRYWAFGNVYGNQNGFRIE